MKKTLNVLQVITLICFAIFALFLLAYSFELDFLGWIFPVIVLLQVPFFLSFFAFIVIATFQIKYLTKLNWVMYVGSILLVLFYFGNLYYSIKVTTPRKIQESLQQIKQARQTNYTELKATVDENSSSITWTINHQSISGLITFMKQNVPQVSIDPLFSEENFSSSIKTQESDLAVHYISFNYFTSGEEGLKKIEEMGYRPATPQEFLGFSINSYKNLKDITVSTYHPSIKLVQGKKIIPVFSWEKGVPTISTRELSSEQRDNEFTLVIKK